jgi:hypothetical protein
VKLEKKLGREWLEAELRDPAVVCRPRVASLRCWSNLRRRRDLVFVEGVQVQLGLVRFEGSRCSSSQSLVSGSAGLTQCSG